MKNNLFESIIASWELILHTILVAAIGIVIRFCHRLPSTKPSWVPCVNAT
jgi:hypothetical protein